MVPWILLKKGQPDFVVEFTSHFLSILSFQNSRKRPSISLLLLPRIKCVIVIGLNECLLHVWINNSFISLLVTKMYHWPLNMCKACVKCWVTHVQGPSNKPRCAHQHTHRLIAWMVWWVVHIPATHWHLQLLCGNYNIVPSPGWSHSAYPQPVWSTTNKIITTMTREVDHHVVCIVYHLTTIGG